MGLPLGVESPPSLLSRKSRYFFFKITAIIKIPAQAKMEIAMVGIVSFFDFDDESAPALVFLGLGFFAGFVESFGGVVAGIVAGIVAGFIAGVVAGVLAGVVAGVLAGVCGAGAGVGAGFIAGVCGAGVCGAGVGLAPASTLSK